MLNMEKNSTYKRIDGKTLQYLLEEENFTGVVVFTAEWMGGAAVLHTMMENYAHNNNNKVFTDIPLYYINSDDERLLSDQLGVNGHLTTLFFKNAEIVGKQDGIISKSALKNKIEHLLH